MRSEYQAQSLFSRTGQAAYESCKASNAALQQRRHEDAQAAELRKAEYVMLQECGERQKQQLDANGNRYVKLEKDHKDLSLLRLNKL